MSSKKVPLVKIKTASRKIMKPEKPKISVAESLEDPVHLHERFFAGLLSLLVGYASFCSKCLAYFELAGTVEVLQNDLDGETGYCASLPVLSSRAGHFL